MFLLIKMAKSISREINSYEYSNLEVWQVPQTSDNKVHLNLAAGAGGGRI